LYRNLQQLKVFKNSGLLLKVRMQNFSFVLYPLLLTFAQQLYR